MEMKHPSEGQRQGPECFLDTCKCPGTFLWLGAVELSVFWSSSTLGWEPLGFLPGTH